MDQHDTFNQLEAAMTLLASIGMLALVAVAYMVLSRIVHGHWPACGW